MTLEPILTASIFIKYHIVFAALSLCIGPWALFVRKRGSWHKLAGRLWVATMTLTALSSFFIYEIPIFGRFSPIHLLSIFALWGLFEAVRAARGGNIKLHKQIMSRLYFASLLVALAFNFLPNRILSKSLFPEAPWLGFALALACICVIFILKNRGGMSRIKSLYFMMSGKRMSKE